MMRLSVVLSLTVALCLLCLLPNGPRPGIYNPPPESGRQGPAVVASTQPGDAESMACRSHDTYGFCTPHGSWVGIIPAKAKQPDAVPQSGFSQWPGCYSLRILHQWGRFWMSFLLEKEKQADADLQNIPSEWPGSFALRVLQKWICFRPDDLHEKEKQPSVAPESLFSEWPGSFGLQRPQNWVRFRMGVLLENLKPSDVERKSVFSEWPGGSGLPRLQNWASDLPFLLRQLWKHLAKADMTCLVYWACQTVWLFCMVWIALGLWRNVKTSHGQGRSQTESCSARTKRSKKASQSCYKLLCQMEHCISMSDSLIRRLRLKELQHQYFKKATQGRGAQPCCSI